MSSSSSPEIGAGASDTTLSMATAKLAPARSAPAVISSTSGNWRSSNAMRRLRIIASTRRGAIKAPTNATTASSTLSNRK